MKVAPTEKSVKEENCKKDITNDIIIISHKKKTNQTIFNKNLKCIDRVRFIEVIAWYVNPGLYVTFSTVYFFLGQMC